jgi:uncharacterized protein (TIGR00730 family)
MTQNASTQHAARPRPRVPHPTAGFDFTEDPTWRIFRIMSEFVDGFQFLSEFKKEVTFFGSARFSKRHPLCKLAEKLARRLSKEGFTIITGGGPGIMEAGNKGAVAGEKGVSVGLNIQLPYEQRVNKYVSKGIGFHYFFTRKVMLSASAQSYVFFPGGFGTLDEFFEIVTLIQTGKIKEKVPIVLIGKDYWRPLLEWIEEKVYKDYAAVDKEDLQLYTLVDTVDEAYEIIINSKERTFF